MTIDVSVIIPALNQEKTIDACLRSLLDQDYPSDRFEVVVVDNGSQDRTGEIIRSFPVTYVFEPKRSSYTARNRGIEHAKGRIFAFMDADCRAYPKWLSSGVAAIEAGKGDLVAGRVRATAGHIPNLYEIYDRLKYLNQKTTVERMRYGATANLFVGRQAIERLGGFDGESISGGDRDLCLRARDCGLNIAYEDSAAVHHVARSTLLAILRKNERIGYGVSQLLRRRPGQIKSALPMLLFMVPRRRFLLDLFRRQPPATRLCVFRMFFLDWLAKQSLVLGCVKGAISERRRRGPRTRRNYA